MVCTKIKNGRIREIDREDSGGQAEGGTLGNTSSSCKAELGSET